MLLGKSYGICTVPVHSLMMMLYIDITSYPCQWKAPRKRKENTLRLADAVFEKHVYGKGKKRRLAPLEDFDPRPAKFKCTL